MTSPAQNGSAAGAPLPAPAPVFPAELLDKICMNIDTVSKLRELRLIGWEWHMSATRALFSHLDVSVDATGLEKFGNVARSPFARLVKSLGLRLQPAGPVVRLGDRYWGESASLNRVVTGAFQGVSPSDVQRALAASLQHLSKLATVDVDVQLAPMKRRAQLFSNRLHSAIFKALSTALPGNFASLVYQISAPDNVIRFDKDKGGMSATLAKVRDLEIRLDKCDGESLYDYTCQADGLWGMVTTHGSQLERLKFHSTEAIVDAWHTMNYSCANLAMIDLANFDLIGHDLVRFLRLNVRTIQTVKLARMFLDLGTFEDLFSCLKESESLIYLDLRGIVYEVEWENPADDCWSLLNHTPLWNMVCSGRPEDLFACKELLFAVNRNRHALGMGPAFMPKPKFEDISEQVDWIMALRDDPFASWPKAYRLKLKEAMGPYPLWSPKLTGWFVELDQLQQSEGPA